MNKEEILKSIHKSKVLNWDKVFCQNPLIIESAYEAMDIYAENTAIKFHRWYNENGWFLEECTEDLHRSYLNNEEHTLSELYQLFLTTIKQ